MLSEELGLHCWCIGRYIKHPNAVKDLQSIDHTPQSASPDTIFVINPFNYLASSAVVAVARMSSRGRESVGMDFCRRLRGQT